MIVALVTCFVVAVVAFVGGYYFAWTRNVPAAGEPAHLAGAMIEQGRALADALHDLRAIERVRALARAEWFDGGKFHVHPANLQDAKLRLLDSAFLETFARRWGLALIGVGEVPVFAHDLAEAVTAGNPSLVAPASPVLAPFGRTLAENTRPRGEDLDYRIVAGPATPKAAS